MLRSFTFSMQSNVSPFPLGKESFYSLSEVLWTLRPVDRCYVSWVMWYLTYHAETALGGSGIGIVSKGGSLSGTLNSVKNMAAGAQLGGATSRSCTK